MTEDDVTQLAWECGFTESDQAKVDKLVRLVRARAYGLGYSDGMDFERNACIRICENWRGWGNVASGIAKSIQARSDKAKNVKD